MRFSKRNANVFRQLPRLVLFVINTYGISVNSTRDFDKYLLRITIKIATILLLRPAITIAFAHNTTSKIDEKITTQFCWIFFRDYLFFADQMKKLYSYVAITCEIEAVGYLTHSYKVTRSNRKSQIFKHYEYLRIITKNVLICMLFTSKYIWINSFWFHCKNIKSLYTSIIFLSYHVLKWTKKKFLPIALCVFWC